MNSLIEKLYYKSPVFIQNMAVSLLGWKLAKERFQKEGIAFLSLLKQTSKYSTEELERFQEGRFVKIARHAIENTVYYKKWAKENNIKVEDINSIDDLKLFPVVEKQQLRQHPEWFKANSIKNQFVLNTSGTTGTPLTILSDNASRSEHYAFFSRLREHYGVNKKSKRATLLGRIIMEGGNNKGPFWRYDYFQKNLLMSSYHLNESNMQAYYEKLTSYKPEEVFTYPSSITPIAEYIAKNNLPKIKLKLVMTTAENLSSYQRQVISQAFDAPIVNQYGCTEMAFFIVDDGKGMLVQPEHGFIEVRDDSNELLTNGHGELIATGLVNWSMPVIRYAVGDEVELVSNNTFSKQQLTSLYGRIDDVLYKMDGTPVGRLDPIFKGSKGIKTAQIIQQKNGSIILKVIPSREYCEEHGEALKLELKKRLGADISVETELVSDIAKQKNGKFRPVISLLQMNT